MNRLQRECLAGSLVLHTGLLVLLVVSAGFVTDKRPTEMLPVLTFIPDILTDKPMMGGGTPQAQQPAAGQTPQLPVVQPPPKKAPEVTPPKPVEPPKVQPAEKVVEPRSSKKPEPAPEPVSPEGTKPAAKKQIEVDLTPTTRYAKDSKAAREKAAAKAAAEAQAREEREAREAAAEAQRLQEIRNQQFNGAIAGLQKNLSGATSVSVPGTGGATYASYSQFVDLIYRAAWAPLKPRETRDQTASVIARVVIARDGSVVSWDITRRSGNASVDKSVRTALERVRTIGRPFPEGATDDRREFDIEFNLQSRGGAG
jgi:outer membrane biosynthesis protein TonB